MPTYYTADFVPINPVDNIAFCQAESKRDARRILRKAIVDAGCDEPRQLFEIKKLNLGESFVINGDY